MKSRCKHLGCSGYGEPVTGYCLAHASEYVPRKPFQGTPRTANPCTPHYNSAKWRAFTKDFLRRNPVCALCGQPSQATDHHLMSAPEMVRLFGGFIYDERYYRPLCIPCNSRERMRKARRGNPQRKFQ